MGQVIQMPLHEFAADEIVYVLNQTMSGQAIVEGKARIERRLDRDHLYEVRFIQEPDATYDRFIRPNDQRLAHSLRASADRARDTH